MPAAKDIPARSRCGLERWIGSRKTQKREGAEPVETVALTGGGGGRIFLAARRRGFFRTLTPLFSSCVALGKQNLFNNLLKEFLQVLLLKFFRNISRGLQFQAMAGCRASNHFSVLQNSRL